MRCGILRGRLIDMTAEQSQLICTEMSQVHEFLRSVVTSDDEHALGQSMVGAVILGLSLRIEGTWDSIRILTTATAGLRSLASLDIATLIRASYDAWLQAEYIGRDAKMREIRARIYVNHRWLEAERFLERLDSQVNQTAALLREQAAVTRARASLPERSEAARALRKQVSLKQKSKEWYASRDVSGLGDLAQYLGCYEEYQWLVELNHGAVHSSWTSIRHARFPTGLLACALATMTWARSVRLMCAILNKQLTETQKEKLSEYCNIDWLERSETISIDDSLMIPFIPAGWMIHPGSSICDQKATLL